MIDWNRVADLRDEIGPEDFDEVVEIFLEEVDAAMDALGSGDEPLEAQFHFLKGSALNLGFSDFAELCRQGEENASRQPDLIDIPAVQQCFAASRQHFLADLEQRFAA